MKNTSFAVGSLLLASVLFAGCFGTTTETKEEFTIASCNDYVKLMKCVAEKSNGGPEALAAVDQAIAAWKTLPEDQLTQTCNMAVEAVASNAAAYVQLGCEVPASATTPTEIVEVATGEVVTGTNETMTGTEVATGEDAAVVQAVADEVATGTSAQ
jgi:hypothetical protein